MAVAIDRWHEIFSSRDMSGLDSLLHDDIVFISPVVHTPQQGKAIATLYLTAADHVLNNGHFEYVRELFGENDAVLEFTTEVDGLQVNGVDLVRWDDNDQIVEFKVMVRPLKALGAVHAAMGKALEALTAKE